MVARGVVEVGGGAAASAHSLRLPRKWTSRLPLLLPCPCGARPLLPADEKVTASGSSGLMLVAAGLRHAAKRAALASSLRRSSETTSPSISASCCSRLAVVPSMVGFDALSSVPSAGTNKSASSGLLQSAEPAVLSEPLCRNQCAPPREEWFTAVSGSAGAPRCVKRFNIATCESRVTLVRSAVADSLSAVPSMRGSGEAALCTTAAWTTAGSCSALGTKFQGCSRAVSVGCGSTEPVPRVSTGCCCSLGSGLEQCFCCSPANSGGAVLLLPACCFACASSCGASPVPGVCFLAQR
mmetsp:Transcript_49923/g.128823  ORF Transcript_49923/g.128823 Transcript_49923/m.128823 type:complete len:296 (-) Transcript_49923:110-997(-)